MSIKEEQINVVHVGVIFYDKSKFKNNAIHESKNSLDLIFTNN